MLQGLYGPRLWDVVGECGDNLLRVTEERGSRDNYSKADWILFMPKHEDIVPSTTEILLVTGSYGGRGGCTKRGETVGSHPSSAQGEPGRAPALQKLFSSSGRSQVGLGSSEVPSSSNSVLLGSLTWLVLFTVPGPDPQP